MADGNLDDFFAKKDKSKKKSKAKFTASELLEEKDKPGEGLKKKIVKKKREKKEPAQNTELDTTAVRKEEDEKWADYEDELETDYTGLGIKNLQISTKEGDEKDEKDNDSNVGSDEEDGEGKPKKESQQGPWKGQAHTAPVIPEPPPPQEEPEVKEPTPEPPKQTGKYVPPSRRAGGEASGMTATGGRHPRKKKEPPNIQSEMDFPTLGGEPAPQGYYSSGAQFERVKGGGKQGDDRSRLQQKLELGNKFDALANTDN